MVIVFDEYLMIFKEEMFFINIVGVKDLVELLNYFVKNVLDFEISIEFFIMEIVLLMEEVDDILIVLSFLVEEIEIFVE